MIIDSSVVLKKCTFYYAEQVRTMMSRERVASQFTWRLITFNNNAVSDSMNEMTSS